ncbi:hypothetical protein OTB20_17790 [Streptomyces sp. H27-H1]|uniref:hypothetical protein n=1 Tax=Streptomyces sp. H27-H1 TaxID=2996461 RepID=UPI00226F5DA6|nr:hypothetical protein [Streptomyces sp. H27-H1]MCY0928016.1 hypothetical protein [Streptomyces sp. H27-H1]
MTEKEHRKPTPPSQAPGESGDREARREAEDAIVPGTKDAEAGDALSPSTDAQLRTAKRNKREGENRKPSP